MTECSAALPLDDPNRCPGQCCAAISLPYSPAEFAAMERSGHWSDFMDAQTFRWARDDLRPLTERQARLRTPWYFEAPDGVEIRGYGDQPRHFYECWHWDPHTGYCTAHERRPPLCQRFPFGEHGENFHPNAVLPPSCAFHRDLGREPDMWFAVTWRDGKKRKPVA